ncbi:MAG TPA: helix-turn-helix transcriptional regulator, partial [Capillimicrobium sp.]
VAAHVLADDPAPAFAQPLVRRAAALLQGPHQRAAAHGRATALLLARGAPPDRVAAHALHAPPSDDPRVVEALATAATDALDRGAPAAAVRLLVRALAEPPAPDHRPAVLAQLGAARLAEDEPTAVATLEAAVAAADDPRAEAAAARELAVALCWHGRYGDALTVLEQARGRLVSVDADAALLLDAVLFSTHFPLVSRAAYVEELAARMRRQVELDGATLAAGAARLALAVSGACRGASAAWVAGEVAAVVERPAVRATLGPELYGYAPVALWLGGRLRDADALAGSLVDEARATGSRFGARSAHTARAAIRLCAGDVRGAQSDVDAARDGDASPSATFARIGLAGMHAEVLAERDEPLAAQRVLAATAVDPDEDVGVSLMHWHRGRAAVARAVGDAAAERSALRDAGAAAQAWRLANPTMLAWRSRLAPLIADLDEAAELLDGELRVARAQGDHGAIGAALHGAALAATGDRQVELLDAAVERLATSGRALDHARALVDLGAALRRTGRRRDARPFLATGADIAARQHGLALARRAQTELRACGARPRTLVLRGVEALTPSERRVAELAADGRTNREIAQALFVTVKTVETHLAHAYRKLDVRGRRDLAPLLEAERAAEDQGATLRRTDGSPA